MRRLGIKGGNGDGIGGVDDDGLKVLEKETTMESVGTVLDEVASRQLVGARYANTSKAGMGVLRLYLENEGWLKCGVVALGMAKELEGKM